MKKRKKTEGARRFVKLTRAHLEMSGKFTDDENKRYAITALCVRRCGNDVIVEATNGKTAWRYPAEWVDADDLPVLAGEELQDGARVLIDPESAKNCLRSLPKSHPVELWKSAYLAVDEGVGVLHMLGGVSFRLIYYGDDARWPDFDGMIPERTGPSITLDAVMLSKIATWMIKLPRTDQAMTMSFHPHHGSSVMVRFNTEGDSGPVGALAPFNARGNVTQKSMPAWRRAWKEARKP